MLRLRFYLDFLGYDVEEIRDVKSPVRDVAEMVAFGILSLGEAASLLEYVEGPTGNKALLQIFRSERKVQDAKLPLFAQVVDAYATQLAAKKQSTQKMELPVTQGLSGQLAGSMVLDMATLPLITDAPEDRERLIFAASQLVILLFPLVDILASDTCTPEDRDKFRTMAGGNGVFLTANRIHNLFDCCSESSRKARKGERLSRHGGAS